MADSVTPEEKPRNQPSSTSSASTLDEGSSQTPLFAALSRVIPWFRNPRNVLIFKLDALLLSWTFLAGILKELDQSATTQAYVSGMRESLHLYGNELVEFTTFFSIGYAIGLVPGQLIQTKVRPSIFLPSCEVIWGLFVIFVCEAKNAQTIYALRFFLGLFSAVFWPSVVSLVCNWYTPAELAVRVTVATMSDVAGAMFLGALQAALYQNMNGVHGRAGWQWLFIVAGAMTIGLGLLGFVLVPDTPAFTRAVWLTPSERELARRRMSEFGGQTSRLIPLPVLRRKLRQLAVHPVTYIFLVTWVLNAWSSRANSYFVLYLESLTDGAGNRLYTTYQVNILPLGGYALQIVTNLALNGLSDWRHWRWQVAVGSAAAQGVILSILCAWPADHRVVLGFYFLTYATNAGSASLLAWLAEILRKEPEARAVIVALTVTIVYVGHATIPLGAWRVADSPRYPIGFPMATAFAFSTVFFELGLLWWERRNPQFREFGYDGPSGAASASDEETVKGVAQGAAASDGAPKRASAEISRVAES